MAQQRCAGELGELVGFVSASFFSALGFRHTPISPEWHLRERVCTLVTTILCDSICNIHPHNGEEEERSRVSAGLHLVHHIERHNT